MSGSIATVTTISGSRVVMRAVESLPNLGDDTRKLITEKIREGFMDGYIQTIGKAGAALGVAWKVLYTPYPEYLSRMDWNLLRLQKLCLIKMMNSDVLSIEFANSLDGIVNLIDCIQDSAVEDCVATKEEVFGDLK